ncbi:hypothetical protein KEM48_013488 [Puccinia striiformis f. sp. tritici PST-130]|nr:hypothetical protein KEM48_013488 [Puccinia striiformis f. sp. tritici PST-130]
MSIEAELLTPYHLIHPEKTSFRIKPASGRSGRREGMAQTNQKIVKIVDDLQRGLLDDLVTFITTTKFEFRASIRQPIPTAVLLGTSKILNASLATRISGLEHPLGGPECLPIQLNSRSCLTLSATIKSIVNSLESRLEHLVDNDSRYSKNIRILYDAHHNFCCRTNAPTSSSDPKSVIGPKLIFIIDEFESFDSGVLEDLISIFSNLMIKIPIMLVLSLNTSAEAIHSLLPRTVIFRLKMTPFAVDMGGGAITSLIQKIAFDPDSVFDLSSGVVRSLMDGYERLNKSIDNLIAKLQFIHLAHFHTNPLCGFLNNFCTEDEDEGEQEREDIEQPPNFEYLAYHLRRKQARGSCLMALTTIERIGRLWPEKERTPEWILYNVYRPELVDYSIEMCKLIKHSNDEMLVNVLHSLSDMASEFDWLEPSLIRISELMSDKEIRKTGARTHLFTNIISDITDALITFFRKNLGPDGLLELQEAWTFDDKILLHEVFHPRYIHQIKSGLGSKKRNSNSIPIAGEKGKGVKIENLDDGEEKMDRLRRMYELYMETNGKIINLSDWFGAFYQQTNPSADTPATTDLPHPKQTGPNKKRKKESSQKNQEFEFEKVFLRSIGDLGFLGFISHCGRKKEHVSKHFFG